MFGTIGRQTSSYRQGMVLGLTLAEIMLLLVFCLLIAVGVTLANERAARDRLDRDLSKAQVAAAADEPVTGSIRRNPRLVELIERAAASGSPKAIDDFWRKLVESEDIVEAMEKRGVPRLALQQHGEDLAKFEQLRDKGIDVGNVARGAALASALDRILPDDAAAKLGASSRTPEVAALIAKEIASTPSAEGDVPNGHNWPPIINLSEAGGYFFATRSAELRPDFGNKLRTTVVARLLEIAASFQVEVIEVIGHTDERPVSGGLSNLDRELPAVVSGASGIGLLQPADNAGLGLARAVAVVAFLSADPRLRGFRILPLSAAQLIGTNGRLTHFDGQGDVRERRRIEIRMRKSDR
jgi:flagellar motor protein MotB